jgi:hypothetical protein
VARLALRRHPIASGREIRAQDELALETARLETAVCLGGLSLPKIISGHRGTTSIGSDLAPVMHLQIVEIDTRLTGRYVASAPHSWTMRVGPTETAVRAGTDQAAGLLSGQLFGPGGNTTLEYWIDGRRIRAAWKAPSRKRPCRSRPLPVDPSFFVSRRLHRIGSRI